MQVAPSVILSTPRMVSARIALLVPWLALSACTTTGGGGWEESASHSTSQLDAIWGTGSTDIWAVGHDGTALHFDGSTWTSSPTGTTEVLFSVWGASPTKYWAGGGETMLEWNGSAWQPDPWFAGRSISTIRGSGPDDVWVALATDAFVAHWDGTAWSQVPIPDGEFFDKIWVAAPDEVWASGFARGLYKKTGASWQLFEVPDVGGVFIWSSISGCSPTDVWATGNAVSAGGDAAFAYHWDGATWSDTQFFADPTIAPGSLTASFCRSSNDVWMVGGAEAYHGSGTTWDSVSTDSFLLGVWAPPKKDVWSVGSVGVILHAAL